MWTIFRSIFSPSSIVSCTDRTSNHVSQMLFLFSHSFMSNFATPWMAARQASLSFTISWSLLKVMSIESTMPSNHLILCCPLLLCPQTPICYTDNLVLASSSLVNKSSMPPSCSFLLTEDFIKKKPYRIFNDPVNKLIIQFLLNYLLSQLHAVYLRISNHIIFYPLTYNHTFLQRVTRKFVSV